MWPWRSCTKKEGLRVADNMSQRKGGRGQKYQNSTAFKPGLYGESRRVKLAAALPVAGVCARCRDKVEWKKKYDKYKPLTVPRKCVVCQQKKVKQAYYRLCQVCAESSGVCAKCGEQGEIVTSFPPSKKAQAQEEEEFKQGLKFMSERERRKLLREQLKGKERKETTPSVAQDNISADTKDCENTTDSEQTVQKISENEELCR